MDRDRKFGESCSRNRQIYWVGGLLAVLAWLADAAIDAAFEQGTFLSQAFFPDLHELAIRLLFVTTQLAFIAYLTRLLSRRRTLEESLRLASVRAQAEKEKSEAILEVLADGISIQDCNLKVLYQNRAHRESMGSHAGEFCYRAYQQREEPCPGCHLLQSFADGLPHRREADTDTPHGRIHVDIISTPLGDASGRIVAGIEAVRDITERKRMEETIRTMNLDLDRRATELAAANRELEAFSYSLSHDLRSYLTRITVAAQTLEEFAGNRLGYEEALCLRSILTAGNGMEELIEAMLSLARATRREMHHQPVDLSALAIQVAGDLRLAEPDRRVTVEIAPGLAANGDAQLLKVVLENLLGNAWKYTRDSARPRIEFSRAPDRDGNSFVVRDNGIGFDMTEADQLFEPFHRLSSARGFPGTGIGLATVQRIITRHGGSLAVESRPGQGASFTFTLP